jgi:hypothetical protein
MRTAEQTIHGVRYVLTLFPAIEGVRLHAYLLGLFGASIGQLFGAVRGVFSQAEESTTIDGDALALAIQRIAEKLTETELLALMRRLLVKVVVHIPGQDGRERTFVFVPERFEESFNTVFEERLIDVYQVLWFVLQSNFPDFFTKAGLIGKLIRRTDISQSETLNEKPA